MKAVIHLTFLILIVGCKNKEQEVPPLPWKKLTNNLMNVYATEPFDYGGSGIVLYNDKTYYYNFGSCLSSGSDSGTYIKKNDTLTLFSNYKNVPDSLKYGHNTIVPQTDKKIKLEKGRAYILGQKKEYPSTSFWTIEVFEKEKQIVLDKNGNGFARLYNLKSQHIEEGEYKNFKLYNGKRYYYLKDMFEEDSSTLVNNGVEYPNEEKK